jgi:hypothetical protein
MAGDTSYVLDPHRDYVVRRIRSESKDAIMVTDVEYRKMPDIGWVPSGWTMVKTRPSGKLIERCRSEVTDLRTDEQIPSETFRLDPMPGEWMTDESRKLYRVGNDGMLEEVDPLTGQAVPTPPPERPRSAWAGRNVVRYGLLPALALFVGALVVLRRRRPPHTPTP